MLICKFSVFLFAMSVYQLEDFLSYTVQHENYDKAYLDGKRTRRKWSNNIPCCRRLLNQPIYTTTTNLSFALFPPYSDELLQFHKTGKFIYVHTITSLALRLCELYALLGDHSFHCKVSKEIYWWHWLRVIYFQEYNRKTWWKDVG